MDIEARLTEIEEELRRGHAEKPEKMLTDLMSQMRKETLAEWRPTLEPVIDSFQPKRKRQLQEILDRRIEGRPAEVREPPMTSGYAVAAKAGQPDAGAEFRNDLEELSRKHIFQWGTHYRDRLFGHFDVFLERMEYGSDAAAASTIQRRLSEHSHEIFTKGYEHERDAKGTSHLGAVKKSVGGLARFLDVPLEYYSVHASHTYQQTSIGALRTLLSAALGGILEGYAAARFGDERGDSLLAEFPESWGRCLAFLTPSAAIEVAGLLEPGPLAEGIEQSVIPLLESIDRLINKPREDYFPVPLSGRLPWDDRFLMVEVRAPRSTPRPVIEARAYLDAERASWRPLTEARAQNVALVIAPLKPEARQFVREREALANMVVEAGVSNPRAVADLAEQVWRQTIYSLRSKRTGEPISHNVARLFPLNEPNLRPSYRVRRTSVRDLLREFDRTNGVRLWCSVRRSGKTGDPIRFYWVVISAADDVGSRDGFARSLSQQSLTHPLVPVVLRTPGFIDPNSAMNDLAAVLEDSKADILDGEMRQRISQEGYVDVVLVSRKELALAVTSSPCSCRAGSPCSRNEKWPRGSWI